MKNRLAYLCLSAGIFFTCTYTSLAAAQMDTDKSGTSIAVIGGNGIEPADIIVFRDMEWGADISSYKGLSLVEDGDIKYYKRADDKLELETVPVDSITYGFFENKLMSIIVYFSGNANFIDIRKLLDDDYGAGVKPNQFSDEYYYCLKCTTTLALNYNDMTKKGYIVYNYRPLDDKYSKYKGSKSQDKK